MVRHSFSTSSIINTGLHKGLLVLLVGDGVSSLPAFLNCFSAGGVRPAGFIAITKQPTIDESRSMLTTSNGRRYPGVLVLSICIPMAETESSRRAAEVAGK